ncbi:MAG: trypsin-like peptidase domain-containing protein [Christensenellales bacterium]
MKKKEWIRKSALAALGIILAAEIAMMVREEGKGEARAESVYAQGEYVKTLEGIQSPFADVVDVVMPCVVGVSNRARTYSIISGQTDVIEQATGSGVMITTQGHVVTNYHVIEGANDVQVLSNGQYLQAEIVGYDELTDLAVLRVTEDVNLPAVKMGDISQVRVGDWAIVIGNPLGKQFADTVTIGVVSALNRELEGTSIVKMMQTDAAINSGNSGGGLFNTKGELIGIPSLKYSSNGVRDAASIEGIAMAIPVDVVKPIVESLIQFGKVTRPKLGISWLRCAEVKNRPTV